MIPKVRLRARFEFPVAAASTTRRPLFAVRGVTAVHRNRGTVTMAFGLSASVEHSLNGYRGAEQWPCPRLADSPLLPFCMRSRNPPVAHATLKRGKCRSKAGKSGG